MFSIPKEIMEADKIDTILRSLNRLLDDTLSLHEVSFEFHRISEVLRKLKIPIEVGESNDYYLDEELRLILEKQNSASNFSESAYWHKREKELLEEKNGRDGERQKPEPSFFEFKNNYLIGYLNEAKGNERLIGLLIEEYNLVKE